MLTRQGGKVCLHFASQKTPLNITESAFQLKTYMPLEQLYMYLLVLIPECFPLLHFLLHTLTLELGLDNNETLASP